MQTYEKLEHAWARYHDVDPRRCVVCSSGTAALHLALECLDLPRDCHVIVPDYTMIACARAVTLARRRVRVADISPRNLLIDAEALRRSITPKTKTVMLVHLYGRRVPSDVYQVARRNDLVVIEDCAEFHGARLSGEADAYCWSFYHNKIVGGEEGGAIIFNSLSKAAKARRLRSLGTLEDLNGLPVYQHEPYGHNYRLSNVHASLILNSLGAIEETLSRRSVLQSVYDEVVPASWKLLQPREVTWVYDVTIPGLGEVRRQVVIDKLARAGVGVRPGFVPISRQKEYRKSTSGICCNTAKELSQQTLYLQCDRSVTERDAERAARLLVEAVGEVLGGRADERTVVV